MRNLVLSTALLACMLACSSPNASVAGGPAGSAPAQPGAGAPLVFTAQPGWIEEEPANDMRAAQCTLPGEGGDASLIVYHFGSGGGSIEANLERWAEQFEQPDGGSSVERMRREDGELNGRAITRVDLSGTFVAETFPGSGEHLDQPGSRMLAAILESDHGRYYVKLVGPAATVAQHESSYRAFLEAVR